MGMSTHIEGFRPPDEKWKKMKKIYDSCMQADITVPDEVWNFFDGDEPSDLGVTVNIEGGKGIKSYQDEARKGYEIDLSKLPKDLKYIRVFNSW